MASHSLPLSCTFDSVPGNAMQRPRGKNLVKPGLSIVMHLVLCLEFLHYHFMSERIYLSSQGRPLESAVGVVVRIGRIMTLANSLFCSHETSKPHLHTQHKHSDASLSTESMERNTL